jgi:GntR family transcriptional regulator
MLTVIESGALRPGDRLPSETELSASYGVTRNTAREDVHHLAGAGVVTCRNGREAIVRDKPRLMRSGPGRYSRALRQETGVSPFHAETLAHNRVPNAYLTAIGRVVPPPAIAQRLAVDPKSESVVRRENWYFADDEPMQRGVTYIPWKIAKDSVLAVDDNLGVGDLYARFEERGHLLTCTREEVTARMPTPEERRGLMLPHGLPVLVVLHTGFDQHHRPFEITEFTMRSDYTGLDYTMPVDH